MPTYVVLLKRNQWGGAIYFLLLKDDFSNYRIVHFLKNKSETKHKIELSIKFIENQTNKKIKILRSDNGLEFINKELKNLLADHGIKHEKSCPYTPNKMVVRKGKMEPSWRQLEL